MKYTWLKQRITQVDVANLIGTKVKQFTVGDIGDDEENPVNGIEIEFDGEPTAQNLAKLDKELGGLYRDKELTIYDLPTSIHRATLKSVDTGNPKPAIVTRQCQGQDFDIPAFVTENIKDQWLAGDIQIGDIVLVTYCEENPDDVIVIGKVFKSW